jgi:hypothetical protein
VFFSPSFSPSSGANLTGSGSWLALQVSYDFFRAPLESGYVQCPQVGLLLQPRQRSGKSSGGNVNDPHAYQEINPLWSLSIR